LRRTKSSVPWRTCSTTAVRLGLTAPSSTACSRVNQATTTSDSGKDQPATVRRTPKTTRTGASVTAIQRMAMRPRTTKSARYCIAVSAEMESWTRKRPA
jgi:hypothetical protein